jgi:hypothetical protein
VELEDAMNRSITQIIGGDIENLLSPRYPNTTLKYRQLSTMRSVLNLPVSQSQVCLENQQPHQLFNPSLEPDEAIGLRWDTASCRLGDISQVDDDGSIIIG